jgi:hypothetical protein
MTMVNKKGITQLVNSTAGPSKQARKAGIVRATSEKKHQDQYEEEDEYELQMGSVKVQEKGKKKAHQFKLDKEKISQPVCIKYYQP